MTAPQPQSPPDPDLPLVQQALAGDFAAFESLVTRHERAIYTLARRIVTADHDAEEVVQETFISVIEHLREFRQNSAFRTWLVRIATNHALKLLRKRRVRATVPLDTPDHDDDAPLPHPDYIARWDNDPVLLAQRHEVQQLISDAMAKLDEKYRLVFLLRDVEGLSIEETADALQITPANVKVRLLRARLQLRELLTQTFGNPGTAVRGHDHEHVTSPRSGGSKSQEKS